MRRIMVFNRLSAWGLSQVQTCIHILQGMYRAGAAVHLDLMRTRVDMGGVPYNVIIPAPLSRFGLTRVELRLLSLLERKYLARLSGDDIAWLWPGASIELTREVARRGHPIIMEGINTRQASAKRILDAAYAAEDLDPAHGITAENVRREEELLSMATHFFSPSPGVDAALTAPGSAFRGQMMQSSYGAWAQASVPRQSKDAAQMTVLYTGTVCIRKNTHRLLRAWARLRPSNARLVLCGSIEPAVAHICREELSLPSVEARGHVADVASVYREADLFVMPSLEEGDPQVTYEAASFGLPVIASPMGGGRLAERTDAVYPIDPYDIDSVAEAIRLFIGNAELRTDYGQRATSAAPLFDWNRIGEERLALLREAFDGL